MTELEAYGSETIKKILLKHGVKEPFFGVKVEQLKIIQKKVKKDHTLANQLYFTGNADAMYLAGLIAEDEKMTKEDLQKWVTLAVSANICEYTVPWVAAGSSYGTELAMEWIKAEDENVVTAGWNTLSGIVALKADAELDLELLKNLLEFITNNIKTASNRTRYTINSFVIAVGTYVRPLTQAAIQTAQAIGIVTVEMYGTACKVPDAVEYIQKAIAKNPTGKKKKTVKC
jgi:3-methyladenine DNA glycosylase AlkD